MNAFLEQITDLSPKRLALLAVELKSQLDALQQAKTEPIALVGMGCRFPGAVNHPTAFWQLLRDGIDPISEVPPERWQVNAYYDPNPNAPGKTYTRWGGFLSQVDQFDPDFFGISPREAIGMDPQQRLLLEVAWEALEHAGQAPRDLVGSKTGVFVGIGTSDYANLQTRSGNPAAIDAYIGTGNGFCFAAGRLSYLLGLQGPSLALDTACTSSLMAVHLACQSLRNRECNLALVGGVNLILSPEANVIFSKTRLMSAKGRCCTFDAEADGYVRSEGCGVVVLKRLSDAEAAGDYIWATIRGTAVNHGGASGGLTIPNGTTQQTVIREALLQSGIQPAQISYVEAQGTGTPIGDPIEVRALATVLGEGRSRETPLFLGSVKTNIGHTETASGMASLIKVVLALHHQELPPHLHFKQLNPNISLEEIPAKIPTQRTSWVPIQGRRIAGINAFGANGTNAHAIVEAPPDRPIKSIESDRPLHLFSVSAKSPTALRSLVQQHVEFLKDQPSGAIADICYSAAAGRSHFNYRFACVSHSLAEIQQQLAIWLHQSANEFIDQPPAAERQKIVFLFPGDATDWIGTQLYTTQPTFRRVLEQCDRLLQPVLKQSLFSLLDSQNNEPNSAAIVFVLEYALAQLWQSWGIQPDAVLGYGVGELVAACVAGMLSLEEALQFVTQPSEYPFQAAAPRLMLVSGATGQLLDHNTAKTHWQQCLIARSSDNLTGIQTLLNQGFQSFLAIGSHSTTLEALQQKFSAQTQLWLSSLDPQMGDWETLLNSLKELYLRGFEVDWTGFDRDYPRQRQPLPTYPFERQRYWLELNDRPPIEARSSRARVSRETLLTLEPNQQQQALESYLRDRIAHVLRVPLVEIESARSLKTLALDSIMALELKSALETDLGVTIAITALLEDNSIVDLATQLVHQLSTAIYPILPRIQSDPEQRYQPFPLNDIQEAYWIGRTRSFEMGNIAAHVYAEFDSSNLDLQRLNCAFQQLVVHHDTLRTIVLPDGQQQVLASVPPYEIHEWDLRGKSPDAVTTELAAIRQQLSHRVRQPDTYPLFEVSAARLDEQQIRLFLSFDNLLVDAASLALLLKQWQQLYQKDTALPKLDLTFRDYVLALKTLEASEVYQRSLTYWQARIPQLPPAPELPLAISPTAIDAPRFVRRTATLPPEIWQQLKQRAVQAGLTASGILLAAYADVLATWSKTRHFTINLTTFNRLPLHPQVNDLVGDFTSLTLLAVDYRRSAPFQQRAQQLQHQLWQDLEHSAVSGVRVLRELSRAQAGSGRITMPVVFTSLLANPQMQDETAFATEWLGKFVYSIAQTPQVWLDHQVYEEKGTLVFNWDAVEELFPDGMVDAMLTAYCRLLEDLATCDQPWQSVRSVVLPTADQDLQTTLNATDAPISKHLLHTLFTTQAQMQPDHFALIASDRSLTYAELLHRANHIGHQLRRSGVSPNQLVAIVLEKGWQQVVAVLGVLMAGGAYVPIDPELPQERRDYLLEQTAVQHILTHRCLKESFAASHLQVWEVEDADWIDEPLLEPVQQPTDLAYVIYTSGSTGLPKGVMIDHQGAVNTILDINQRFQVGTHDRVFALSSLSFDLSVYDIFGTLAAGGTIVLPPARATKDPAVWSEILGREQVTLWNSVPALMQMLLEYGAGHCEVLPDSLRLVLLSGDWLPLSLPDRLKQFVPAVQVVSLGGATEASIWSILYPITSVDPAWKSIPYGQPMQNQQFYVLDEQLEPRPIWVPGQLYIAGMGLAQGYWQDDTRTIASFIEHPQIGRLYNTGDLGRYLPNGQIEFLGREDSQVKLRGYRIELGEIEAMLEQHPAVKEAVVLATGDQSLQQLVAYLVPDAAESDSLFLQRQALMTLQQFEELTRALQPTPELIDLQTFSEFWQSLEQLYLNAAGVALHKLGAFNSADETNATELLRHCQIQPRYQRWLQRALTQLAQTGWLRQKNDRFVQMSPLPTHLSPDLITSVHAGATEGLGLSQAATQLLLQIAENLADILTETQHSAEIYTADAVPEIYQKQFQVSNSVMRSVISAIAQSRQSEPLRILEVGAGIGSTTLHLLPVLPPDRTTYLFTDISSYFLQRARSMFAAYPFLQTGLLDLEQDPQEQGYELHTFDIVIASSVLHATRNIDETLHHIRSLLAPEGLLLLLEETQFHPAFDLSMGLQQGFDRFEDIDLRQQHPLLSQAQWRQVLTAAGFTDCQILNQSGSIAERLGFDVLLARGPTSVQYFQPQKLRTFLAEKLPEYMLPSAYLPMETLPLTANGKVDRRSLLALKRPTAPIESSFVAPRTTIETALADIWSQLLGRDRIGIHDTFFDLGGDSLLATQVISRVREVFSVEVSLRNLFEEPTVAKLAEVIAQSIADQVDPDLLTELEAEFLGGNHE
ncbi:amino acid adenylation domain-containing protein (plasmid) [Leptolyngbya sp. NIES-3755]|nr:amino acid adenylation domain-containing protein [Leptolyngbya sp. NIES-3755]